MKKFFLLTFLLIGSHVYAQPPVTSPISPVTYGTAFSFSINGSGQMISPTLSACPVPGYSFAGFTQWGMAFNGSNQLQLCTSAGASLQVLASQVQVNGATLTIGTAGTSKWDFQLNGTNDGQVIATNGAGSTGVGWDIATDGIFKVQTRAFANTATLAVGTLSTNQISIANVLCGNVNPTISSGFGTSPSVPTKNGTCAFTINVGTGGTATSGVVAFNTSAANGWTIHCDDTTTQSASVFITKQTADTTTTATISQFNTAAALTAWASADVLKCHAAAY